MTTRDHDTMAESQRRARERYMALHLERAHQAELYLRSVEQRYALGELDQQELLDACLRMLIDLSLKKRPAIDLAAAFLRYALLVPSHMRVPFVQAVARCCEANDADSIDDKAWSTMRKKLHGIVNKVAGLLYELNIEFLLWRLRDPAQEELFRVEAPPLTPQGTTVRDDGGALVDAQTGEMLGGQD